MHPLKSILPAFILVAALQACSSNEIGESRDVAQDKIYQQFEVRYTEGSATARVFCQFRFAGQHGTTLVLDKPSQLNFDEEVMKVDSSTTAGAYYQVERPAASFFGPHRFTFTDINNKKLVNSFSFDPFRLANATGAAKKQALQLPFETPPLTGDDYIEVGSTNTDSSFTVTHTAGDTGNFITIPAKQLQRQKGRTLSLQATLYRTMPLQQNTAEGGRLSVTYTLQPITIKLND